jgi:hypothetical protein
MARDPWKLTSLLWPALIAALMPLHLHELVGRLPRIGERLASYDALVSKRDPHQLHLFRRSLLSPIPDE